MNTTKKQTTARRIGFSPAQLEARKEVNVTGQAFNRKTGEPAGEPRTEKLNLFYNPLFNTKMTVIQIKQAYESFWNELNPNSKEIVFVQRIELLF